jgi:hypothetical protein
MVKEEKKVSHVWLYLSILLTIFLIGGAFLFFQNKIIQKVNQETIDCGDGTTIASDKTLCWQKNSQISVSNWDAANNYCENLNLSDKDDWRLPTVQELANVIETNKTGLKINEELFPNTFEKNYWSSSVYNNNPNMHWFAHFSTGFQGYGYNYNSGYAVRCIRDIRIV